MIITGKKFSKPEMSRVKNGDIILKQERKEERVRLDLLLVEKYPEYNRSTLQNFIKSGYVTVDGDIIKKPNAEIIVSTLENGQRTKVNPKISLKVPQKKKVNLDKESIIYEDDNVLVINKPAGLLSMAKGEWTDEPTLEDFGLLVHRLDRDTSGVVILAKNEATQKYLRNQFQERKTHKTYYAITTGIPKIKEAKIDLPIARNLNHPTTFMVDPKGKPAETYYKVLKENSEKNLALIELKPITGRTHQLRVHLKYIGCPILGDRIYNKEHVAARLFLHAGSLEITIPGANGGKRSTFTSPVPLIFSEEMK